MGLNLEELNQNIQDKLNNFYYSILQKKVDSDNFFMNISDIIYKVSIAKPIEQQEFFIVTNKLTGQIRKIGLFDVA